MEMQEYERQHLELVRSTAGECAVLLRSNGAFPLDAPCRIAAYGNGVRHTIKGGTGSGEVNSRFSITIEEGLKNAGFSVSSFNWLDAYDKVRAKAGAKFIKQIKAEAKAAHKGVMSYVTFVMGKMMPEPEYELPLTRKGDVAIYVVSRDSGEGCDRKIRKGDVLLTDSEVRDILYLDSIYDCFMLVLNVGGVVDLTPVKDVSNILVLSQLGVVTGDVLADILLGRQNPSGKLATTWASPDDYCSIGSFGGRDDAEYKEGIYVGYRYFDVSATNPIFPFGFGLSYTDFLVQTDSVSLENDTVTLTATVKNIGNCPGKETVQVYLSSPWGKLDKPCKELAAFQKTELIPAGGSEKVTLAFKLSDMASYDESSASYILEQGDYIIRLGNSSAHTKIEAIVTLAETVSVLKTKNVLDKPGFEDWRPENKVQEQIPETAVRLTVNVHDIPQKEIDEGKEIEIDEFVRTLTDEELAFLAVGEHDPNAKGIASVIGNASPNIAGAAGETTSRLKEKGLGALVMADGPAGLRLSKEYYIDKKGTHSIGESILPDTLMAYLNLPLRFLATMLGLNGKKPPKKAKILNQYATMIPVGTALAQSWNPELVCSLGDMVGEEMTMFGIHLWLAPALNIHRSILCGRNFEYYSEDPLLSGKIAAAITRGVQQHPGRGTTIKHYAANNQETNRYANNSIVSERAMREIYLKGFGISVKESQPLAVMTSYNLVNGTHAAEHRGLIEDVLRSEFGFEGIIMTDWVAAGMLDDGSKYQETKADAVASAGGDLFMPGSKADFDRVLAMAHENRKQLEMNATRVVRMIKKLVKE